VTGDRAVIATLLATLAGFIVYGLAVDSPFTWIYIIITVVLGVAVLLIHRAVRFPPRVLWGLTAAAAGNLAGGIWLVDGQPLYVYKVIGSMRFDKPFHFVATGIAAWAALEVLRPRLRPASTVGVAFVAVMMAAGAGALVEIVEYTGTLILENANVGDYGNNMADLVANLLGAMTAVTLAHLLAPATARVERTGTG